jgi:hypothetical protein
MPLDILCYKDFIKPDCLNGKIGADIPSQYLLEPFQKLLKVIRRYFTCEGRFDRVYPYHIRLLMHFTGKKPLNLPFFLYQSLEKMADNVQAKADQPGNNLSHLSLIKLLVVEELRHLNKDWDSFMISADIPRDPKGDIPLSARETTFHSAGERKEDVMGKGKGKEIEDSSSHQPTPQKRGRPRLTNKTEEIQAPSKPRTKSAAKRLLMRIVQLEPVEGARKGIDERWRKSGDENVNVQELSQQLKQAQHAIAELYQENRELRRQLAERTIEMPTSQSRAGNVNWLKKQLREAQDVIIQLREEQRVSEERITEHFKECRPTIDNACITLASAQEKLKGNMVLWRQVKSLSKQTGLLEKHSEF